MFGLSRLVRRLVWFWVVGRVLRMLEVVIVVGVVDVVLVVGVIGEVKVVRVVYRYEEILGVKGPKSKDVGLRMTMPQAAGNKRLVKTD